VFPAWGKATNDYLATYRSVFSSLIRGIELPIEALLCKDFDCCNAGHFQAINSFADSIPLACAFMQVSSRYLELNCGRHETDHVQSLLEKSMLWHHLWIECRPKTGIVADIKRRTRAAYHYTL
jgi:hypothetical protein